MKKSILTIVLATAWWCLYAQSGDTIWMRDSTYWYPHWYDECEAYTYDVGWMLGAVPGVFSKFQLTGRDNVLLVERMTTEHPILADGVAVFVAPSVFRGFTSLNGQYADEYVLVCHMDSSGRLVDTLARARWDTATTRAMLLPQNHGCEVRGDTTYAVRIQVYEAWFEHSTLLDGDFAIVGTYNSNELVQVDGLNYYKFKETAYTSVKGYTLCNDCYSDTPLVYYDIGGDTIGYKYRIKFHGPFLPIKGHVELTVLSADTLMGSATGGGTYRSSEPTVISATAAPYCRFTGWSDGVADNPRVMHLWQDSTVVAQFVNDSSSYVRVLPNNPDWGSVTGTGIYPWGQSVDIAATPFEGYRFTEWADGSRDNPRTVQPTSDTVFTAIFDPVGSGIQDDAGLDDGVAIRPNPTHGIINIVCPEGSHTMLIHDAAGRLVRSVAFSGSSATVDIGDLTPGIYTVSLGTGDSKVAKTIIKL
ncbi:MAG: T9SS type A sorting domain-containing protein [Bacteroidales bacterium]|nr:T9SS type A sorting domain-containing protein [Bacteroidales bacterium]